MRVVFLGVMLTNGQKGGSMEDLISRKMAIDEIKALYEWHDTVTEDRTIDHLKRLPSAQPETHEERTETHACDLISRQAAIDAIKSRKTAEQSSAGIMRNAVVDFCIDIVKKLPSAQPEIIRCKDCKYNSNTCGNYVNCDIIPQMFGRTTDNFCSRAERKTDEKENI